LIALFDIVQTVNATDSHDFVALGSNFGGSYPYHSLLVVRYSEMLRGFQYFGTANEIDNIPNDCFHTIMSHIQKSDIPAFIAHCKNVIKNASPEFGYFYSGDEYDQNGVHFSNFKGQQRMTCVGFCLAIIKGFIDEEEFINYTDWNQASLENEYLTKFCEENNFNISDIESHARRITPLDYIACGLVQGELPIRKKSIDNLIPDILNFMVQHEVNSSNNGDSIIPASEQS